MVRKFFERLLSGSSKKKLDEPKKPKSVIYFPSPKENSPLPTPPDGHTPTSLRTIDRFRLEMKSLTEDKEPYTSDSDLESVLASFSGQFPAQNPNKVISPQQQDKIKQVYLALQHTANQYATSGSMSLEGIVSPHSSDRKEMAILSGGLDTDEIAALARQEIQEPLGEDDIESNKELNDLATLHLNWHQELSQNYYQLMAKSQDSFKKIFFNGQSFLNGISVDKIFRLSAYAGASYSPRSNNGAVLHDILDATFEHTANLVEFLAKNRPSSKNGINPEYPPGTLDHPDITGLIKVLIAFGSERERNYDLVEGTIPSSQFSPKDKKEEILTSPRGLLRRFYDKVNTQLEGFLTQTKQISEAHDRNYTLNWKALEETIYLEGPEAFDSRNAPKFLLEREIYDPANPYIGHSKKAKFVTSTGKVERLKKRMSKIKQDEAVQKVLVQAGGHVGIKTESFVNQAPPSPPVIVIENLEAAISKGNVAVQSEHAEIDVEFLDPNDPDAEIFSPNDISTTPLTATQNTVYKEFIFYYYPAYQVNPEFLIEQNASNLEQLLSLTSNNQPTRQAVFDQMKTYGAARSLIKCRPPTYLSSGEAPNNIDDNYKLQEIIPIGFKNGALVWSSKEITELEQNLLPKSVLGTQLMATHNVQSLPPGDPAKVSAKQDTYELQPVIEGSIIVCGEERKMAVPESDLGKVLGWDDKGGLHAVVDPSGNIYGQDSNFSGHDKTVPFNPDNSYSSSGETREVEILGETAAERYVGVQEIKRKTSNPNVVKGSGNELELRNAANIADKTSYVNVSEVKDLIELRKLQYGDSGRTESLLPAIKVEDEE
ncbi:hypothetical protein HOI26_01185 [Candidatus Woesearchaeota archaeon]|jgi:hypothetical protein|nr:hypothetical protein [Candidatus Woesearchaeota archaeon]MBT5739688.1 hypothetical protein [Candidatus Woesearchaeota archaeon]